MSKIPDNKTTCQECGKEFRFNLNKIKPKLCLICHNKKLLERSNFAQKKSSPYKTGKVSTKNEKGLKRTKSPKSKAKSLADTWFSRYIRIKYAYRILNDGAVLCQCIVTKNIKAAKFMDCGHCFSRAHLALRYEEDNCRPQTRDSNRFKGEASHYVFKNNLSKEIGQDRVDEMERLKNNIFLDDNTEYYQEMADKYRKLTNELIEEFDIKKWW